jgi:hypothetical protein
LNPTPSIYERIENDTRSAAQGLGVGQQEEVPGPFGAFRCGEEVRLAGEWESSQVCDSPDGAGVYTLAIHQFPVMSGEGVYLIANEAA